GIDKILIREVSKNKEKLEEYVGSIVTLKILIFFMLIFVILAVSKIMNLSETKFKGIAITSFFLFFQSLRTPISAYFRVNLKMQYSVLATLFGSVAFIMLILWFIQLNASIHYFFLAYVISYMVSTTCIYIFSRRFHKIEFKLNPEIWKYFIKISIPFGLVILLTMLNDRVGILILSWLEGDKAVGYFSAPLAITMKLTVIPFASMLSLFPIFSIFYEDRGVIWKKSFEISFKYLFILSIFLAVISTIYSEEIVTLLFGREFMPSVKVFPILMWSIIFIFINFILVDVITSAGRQKVLIPIFGFALIITVILNLVLVPKYSFIGTALSVLISKSVISICCIYYLFYKFSVYPNPSILIKTIFSSILLLVILSLVKIPMWLAMPVGVIIYLILLFYLRILDTYDINLLKKLYL
ncbi:oligosaccharide flippase family protein, partial [Persephonella sp.]